MNKIFLCIFLCFFFTKSFCVQKFYFKNIFWNIKNEFDISKYEKILSKKFGNFIKEKNIFSIINFLYKIDFFDKIKIYKFNKNLYINLHYKPIINNIFIIGNNILSNSDIIIYLKKFNIKKNAFLNDFLILKVKNFIYRKYRNLGIYNVKIIFKKIFLKNKFCILKIYFYENKYLNIKNIFLNKKTFIVKKRINFFYRKNIFLFKIFGTFINFNLDDFIVYLNLIKKKYLNYGYFDIDIKKIYFIFLNKTDINIKIYLSEGKRYKIHDLFIYSNKNIKLDKILNKVKYIFLKNNKYYKYNILKKIIIYIKKFFKENGFLNVKIDLDYQFIDYEKIMIFLYIKLDKIFYVNKIFFKNISLYEKKILYNNIPKIENNLFNEYLINLGKLNLKKTNFFSSVDWKKKKCVDKINKLDIIYLLEKNNDSKLNFNINYDKKNNLNYEVSLLKNNFLYLGNNLFIKGIKNNLWNYSEINLINPINYVNNFYIQHKLFYNYIINNYFKKFNYVHLNYGYKNNFLFKLDNYFKYKFGIYYIYNNFYVKKNIYFSNVKNNLNIKNTKNFLIINNLYINKLDNNILPEYGFYINFNSKFTFLNLYKKFYNIYISWSKYLSLSKDNKWIWFIHNYLDYSNDFKNEILPFYKNLNFSRERFLRVFDENINYINKKYFLNTYKNNLIFLLTNELIIPNKFLLLNNTNLSKNIRTSFFIDSGLSINTGLLNKLNFKDFLKVSTGISLKFVTYLGTINLSYGFPLINNINDKINSFQFNIGNFF